MKQVRTPKVHMDWKGAVNVFMATLENTYATEERKQNARTEIRRLAEFVDMMDTFTDLEFASPSEEK